jgi:hypothetical protein
MVNWKAQLSYIKMGSCKKLLDETQHLFVSTKNET